MRNMTSQDMKLSAKVQLKGHWGAAVLIMFITWLAIAGVPTIMLLLEKVIFNVDLDAEIYDRVSNIVSFVLAGPLSYGASRFYMNLYHGREAGVADLFTGCNRFGRCFLASLAMGILTFLWALLLIIPGIIAAISYSQTYYLLNDYETLSFMDAITLSKLMMRDYKLEYFLLCLTFIGWWLLVVVTLGIAIIVVGPYLNATFANFYMGLKEERQEIIDRFMAGNQN